MPIAELIRRFSRPTTLVGAVLILSVVLSLFIVFQPRESAVLPPETAETIAPVPAPPAAVSDSGTISPPEPTPRRESLPVGREGGREAAPATAIEVAGRVDSWQDWNSSFSDTVTRTYSAIFDSARLDTFPGGLLVFSPSGKSVDFRPVQRVFCRIDSVRELVKYTFPGQEVKFNIGVAFAPSFSLRGTLHPRDKRIGLEIFPPDEGKALPASEILRNQFLVVLNSPTGYAYTLRTGIESAAAGERGGTIVYYTSPVVVEFRRMIRYVSLLSAAADTVFLLTGNPRAISDLARTLPGAVINAVFVPRVDPGEAEGLESGIAANVRLHVSSPRTLQQSFLIINDSEALVEENLLDPDFMHIARLRRNPAPPDQVGSPRITHLILSRSAVTPLKETFRRFGQPEPRR